MVQPELIKVPFAKEEEGTKKSLPLENAEDTSVVTQKRGWQEIYSQPLEAGGMAPKRKDMNTIFYWITNLLSFAQKGWIWNYEVGQQYYAPSLVWNNGKLYFCKKDPPGTGAEYEPYKDNEHSYWTLFSDYLKENIPVNDGELTIQTQDGDKNPVKVGTFTANSVENKTATIPVGNAKTIFAQKNYVPDNDENMGEVYANQTVDSVIWLPKANNGKLTLNAKNGEVITPLGSFTANDTTSPTVNIPIGEGVVTVKYNGTIVGTFSVNQSENSVIDLVGDVVPVGTVQAWAGNVDHIPEGWLLCDGYHYDTEEYRALFSVIGYKFGNSGSRFCVPNLVNRFIEGTNTDGGTAIEAGLPDIIGAFPLLDDVFETRIQDFTGAFKSSNPPSGGKGDTAAGDCDEGSYLTKFKASDSNPIYGKSDTVQPPAVCMLYIIKY